MKITRINVLLGQPAEGPTNCPAGLSLAQPSARCLRIRLLRGTWSFSAPRRAHLTREKAQVSSAPPEPPVPFSVAGRIRTPGRSLSHAAEGKRATGGGGGLRTLSAAASVAHCKVGVPLEFTTRRGANRTERWRAHIEFCFRSAAHTCASVAGALAAQSGTFLSTRAHSSSPFSLGG